MIDDGETDWKMIVIDVKDPIADKVGAINVKEAKGARLARRGKGMTVFNENSGLGLKKIPDMRLGQ